MLRGFRDHIDDMALAITVWMCSLPLVGLFVIPFFGINIAAMAAVALLIAAIMICCGICTWKTFRR